MIVSATLFIRTSSAIPESVHPSLHLVFLRCCAVLCSVLCRRVVTHRCLGVVIFYSKTYFEATAAIRISFPREMQRLRPINGNQQRPSPSDDILEEVRLHSSSPAAPAADRESSVEPEGAATSEDVVVAAGDVVERGEAQGVWAPSRLEADLGKLPDGAVIVRLNLRECRDANRVERSERRRRPSITLVCCHLWYNPRRPDIKTAQCGMLFDAIKRFHARCGCAGADAEIGADDVVGETGQAYSTGDATNLIVCGDFNAVPMLQPEYFPKSLKVRRNDRRVGDTIPNISLTEGEANAELAQRFTL